jgi:DNA uptake protein ComE-like DNA-binding protein
MNFVVVAGNGWPSDECRAQNDLMRRRLSIAGLTAARLTALLVLVSLSSGITSRASRSDGLVDINRASVPELMRVSGMAASWAGRIVRFRPYRTKLDLLEQGVVPPEVYRRIRDGIVAHRVKDGK